MSRFSSDDRVIPSVLDRLIDEDPSQRTESPASRSKQLEEMRQGVARDLQDLLNARCRATSWPEGLTHIKRSLFAYGIPDCVGITTGSQSQHEKLKRTIAKAIEYFEPRLMNIEILIIQNDDPSDRTLRFRINGMLRVDPAPEPVTYDSDLDATIGDFSVKKALR